MFFELQKKKKKGKTPTQTHTKKRINEQTKDNR